MAFQVPKENHPWRQYQNKETPAVQKDEKRRIKEVRLFISELAESWDNVEVITTAYGREDRFKLTELPQGKQAAWLAGILRRNYG